MPTCRPDAATLLCFCSLSKGGAPPRFLIIDDGWQQIASENKPDPNVAVQEGAQYVHCTHRISLINHGWLPARRSFKTLTKTG